MRSRNTTSELEPDEYPVKAVIGQKINRTHDRCFSVTEWEETDSRGKNVVTSEPLEKFIRTPAPIFEFVSKGTRSRLSKEDRRRLTCRKCPREYIPNGKEFVKKVYFAFSPKVKSNAEEFYGLRFWGDERLLIVRLIHMKYHLQRKLFLFWTKNGSSGSSGPEFCA
jgi:hypothetical protein